VRAVVVREPGSAENLELADVEQPTARPGRVVVRVGAAGVNPVDAGNRADPGWAGIEPPFVVGYEFAGWVEEVGAGVGELRRGDAVWGVCSLGGLSGASHASAFVDGYQVGLYTAAAVMTAGALLALVALRPDRHERVEPLAAVPEPS
jgi:NADPH:quinone reductase-like Zn-dependent oxidoreductase